MWHAFKKWVDKLIIWVSPIDNHIYVTRDKTGDYFPVSFVDTDRLELICNKQILTKDELGWAGVKAKQHNLMLLIV